MAEQGIKPEKITKPIQLLGAWLAGLFSIDSCFLVASANMEAGSFESIALVIASIINVPIFLVAVFLLQTKFRPELQEDSYYSSYLSQKTNERITVSKSDIHLSEVSQRLSAIEKEISKEKDNGEDNILEKYLMGVNRNFDDRAEIKKILSEYGVTSISSFGADSSPDTRSVAIAHSVPRNALKKILEIAKRAKFTHYGFFDNRSEETDEEILFGAYGASEFELVE